MLKKLLGSLLIGTMVLWTVPAAFAAENIEYVVNDNFNITDTEMYDSSDGMTYRDPETWIDLSTGKLVDCGTGSSAGVADGALVIDSRGPTTDIRWDFTDTPVTGEHAVVEFLFSVEKMTQANVGNTLIKIADSTGHTNTVADIKLEKDITMSGNQNIVFQATTNDGAVQLNQAPIFGGDTMFLRFEMNYEEQTFTMLVRNLDMGTEQEESFTMKNTSDSLAQFGLNVALGNASTPNKVKIDDLKVYDATNGYAPEPAWPNRENIVAGLTGEQIETNDTSNAEKAFDGDISVEGRWLPDSATATPELIMHLGEEKTFDSANIFSSNGAGNALKECHLEYFDGEAWQQIEGASFSSDVNTQGNIYLHFAPVTASDIKFVMTGRNTVKEICIYAPSNPPANVSLSESGGVLTATADVYYYPQSELIPLPEDGVQFIAAYYDGDAFTGIEEITVSEGLTNYHGSNTVTFNVPAGEAGQTVRLFYWDSLGNLRPLGNAAEITTPAA